MKTEIVQVRDDWRLIKNACRTTARKEATDKDAADSFKRKILLSEHSPIRLFEVYWRWRGIKYWLSTEWSRHKFEKFISTQRNDRQTDYDRNEARQDAPVNFDGYANMQSLIDAWRKRLCFQATDEARELAEDFKRELHKTNPLEADVLVPNCVYRGGCPEFQSCGLYKKFAEICDLQERYDKYNEWFYGWKRDEN